jgi:ribosome-associated toxin RatA of RatAB toxin-antitoxin module
MPTVRKSVIVPHSCAAMFDLVDAVERYPEFLPWCARTRVLERDDAVTVGRVDIDFRGLRTSLTTRNRKERPASMSMELVEGPFERFSGEWRFAPLGETGCRVELALEYAAASALLDRVLAGVFAQIAETLVDRFVAEADAGGAR